jgi:hypothetical protein
VIEHHIRAIDDDHGRAFGSVLKPPMMFAEALIASQTSDGPAPAGSVCTKADPLGGPFETMTGVAFVTFPPAQVKTVPGPFPRAATGNGPNTTAHETTAMQPKIS